jgi:23S rRNA pseudouridine2605 synthase
MATERIQKLISKSGLMSRRSAEQAILDKRVAVDGVIITELGRATDAEKEVITVDGKNLPVIVEKQTYLFYKPVGVVTTKSDPDGKPTVMDFFKDEPGLNPVGRLDFDSEGLLLMTHDGDLLLRLTHPRYEISKVYEVEVSGIGSANYRETLLKGVSLSDGVGKFDLCEVVKENKAFLVTVSEGRNRFIRRMFGALGLTVTGLKRIRMGEYELGTLKPGERKRISK